MEVFEVSYKLISLMFIPQSDRCKSAPHWVNAVRAGKIRRGFTLLEVLVAMSVFLVLMGILFSLIGQSSSILQRTQNDVNSYQSARLAFTMMTRNLSQSRMGVYNDYNDQTNPKAYLRKSDLNFVVSAIPTTSSITDFGQGNAIFFQAPLGRVANTGSYGGMPGLLNSLGYYVTYGPNPSLPDFLKTYDRNRFRLMQFLAPTEDMKVYMVSGSNGAWYTGNSSLYPDKTLLDQYSTVIADNVILLLCWPRLSKEEDPTGTALTGSFNNAYRYNSQTGATDIPQPITANQQPPLVQVTMVVLDKVNADRLPNTTDVPTAISDALKDLFTVAKEGDADTAGTFQGDLALLESRLTEKHIGYQIFNSTVPLRETKWTK